MKYERKLFFDKRSLSAPQKINCLSKKLKFGTNSSPLIPLPSRLSLMSEKKIVASPVEPLVEFFCKYFKSSFNVDLILLPSVLIISLVRIGRYFKSLISLITLSLNNSL